MITSADAARCGSAAALLLCLALAGRVCAATAAGVAAGAREAVVVTYGRGLAELRAKTAGGRCAAAWLEELAVSAGESRRVVVLDTSPRPEQGAMSTAQALPAGTLPHRLEALGVEAVVPPTWHGEALMGLSSGGDKQRFVKWAAAQPERFAWFVESDAVFTGAWSTFFDGVAKDKNTKDADLVGELSVRASHFLARMQAPWWSDVPRCATPSQPRPRKGRGCEGKHVFLDGIALLWAPFGEPRRAGGRRGRCGAPRGPRSRALQRDQPGGHMRVCRYPTVPQGHIQAQAQAI